jgi:hypothetical protein
MSFFQIIIGVSDNVSCPVFVSVSVLYTFSYIDFEMRYMKCVIHNFEFDILMCLKFDDDNVT